MVRQLLGRSILWMGVLDVALPASPAFGQRGAQDGEWRSYGGDAGSTKYSALDAIDETNVQNLQVVWRWQSVDYERQAEDSELTFNDVLLATPLKVGNALFTSTNLGQAAAIDPATGETLWVYNSLAEGTGTGPARGTRGSSVLDGRIRGPAPHREWRAPGRSRYPDRRALSGIR